jgi:hypothetical protein
MPPIKEGGSFETFNDPQGNPLIALNRDGTILTRGIDFADGTKQSTGSSGGTLSTPAIFIPGVGTDPRSAALGMSTFSLANSAVTGIAYFIFSTPYVIPVNQIRLFLTTAASNLSAIFGVYNASQNLLYSTGSFIIPASGITTFTPSNLVLSPGTYYLVYWSNDTLGQTFIFPTGTGISSDYYDDYNVGAHNNPGIGYSNSALVGGNLPPVFAKFPAGAADIAMPIVVFGV